MATKRVLIVEAGSEYTKRHLLEGMRALPYEFYLLQTRFFEGSNRWTGDWFPADRIIQVESMDPEEICRSVLRYTTDRAIRFDGVMTFWEGFVPIAQHLQVRLGLPRICTGDIRALRHKGLMRQRVSKSLMKQPQFHVVREHDDIDDVLPLRHYPLIVKPAEMAASMAVTKVHNDAELCRAIAEARSVDLPGYAGSYRQEFRLSRDVLIEEYIPCDFEISVEGIVHRGQLHIAAMCQKLQMPEPFFWEYGHVTPPPGVDDDIAARLRVELQSVISSLELHNCSIHAEIRVLHKRFYFMEVGSRIGGDLIPEIVTYSSGINLFTPSAMLSVNDRPSLPPNKQRRYSGEYRFNTVHTPLPEAIPSLIAKKRLIENIDGVMSVRVKTDIENTIFGDLLAVANSDNMLSQCFDRAIQILKS